MDGIINVYKEKGMTSFDVTYRLRKILSEKKIGHTGTLDPMAEGVLVVCAGRATKLVDSIAAGEKVYEAEMILGIETDTEDSTGELLRAMPVTRTEEEIRRAVLSMVGKQEQIPPMYSAKKQNGKRLYELARQGKVVERKPNQIEIFEIQIQEIRFSKPEYEDGKVTIAQMLQTLPRVRFTVRCSKGTYVRTICADIGKRLGCGAAMSALKRCRVGGFSVEESHTLEELAALQETGKLYQAVMPPIYIPEDTAVTFGKFDGGHRGHQLIFRELFRTAKEKKLKTALLTFSQNPDIVVHGTPKLAISQNQEHRSRLETMGFDYIFEFPMTKETMCIPAEDFLRDVLVGQMRAKSIVVGTDCSFGYRAQGDAALLESRQDVYGYDVHIVEKLRIQDSDGEEKEVSSTLIKQKLEEGNVGLANAWLGRYFSIAGVVQHGRQLGGTVLDFPTANLLPTSGKVIPGVGVYISRVFIDQKLYWGMTNVGDNPTVSAENPISIETHVLGQEGDLYGKKIRIDFVKRIRAQKKFGSLEALKAQLQRDRETVLAFAEGRDIEALWTEENFTENR